MDRHVSVCPINRLNRGIDDGDPKWKSHTNQIEHSRRAGALIMSFPIIKHFMV